jgi:hypothetical protein
MNYKMKSNHPERGTIYAFGLFFFVFVYLCLRALYNAPLHDEIACFFNYIEPGRIFEEGLVQDAQNHLLNSFLTRGMFLLFGDNFFFLRLPNLLSFPVFFLAIYRLSKLLRSVRYRLILVTALTTVSFYLEYFAYSRGYGMGLAFFAWLLVYTIKWGETRLIRHAALVYLFAYLAVFSNLIYFGTSCLAFLFIVSGHLCHWKINKRSQNALYGGLHLSFLLSILPFLWFGYLLKMGGGLYYGSSHGLWEVTGKSLAQQVFYSTATWIKFGFLAFFVLAFVRYSKTLMRRGSTHFVKQKDTIIAYYFFGNLLLILVLALFFKVNYPQDRIAMYLIPLFLLLFCFLAEKSKLTRPIIYLLLYFPAAFLCTLNLDSSNFSPEDRMSSDFYRQVRSKIAAQQTMSIDPMLALTWCWNERKQPNPKMHPTVEKTIVPFYEVIVTKKNRTDHRADLHDYSIIAQDNKRQHLALVRKTPFLKQMVLEYEAPPVRSRKSKIKVLPPHRLANYQGQPLHLQISGDLRIDESYKKIKFSIETQSGKKLHTLSERWVHGPEKQEISLQINCLFTPMEHPEEKLFVNICNPEGRLITFKNVKIEVFEITP